MFLKDASVSTLRAFNALVLHIERLSAIATPEEKTEKAKITNLMNTKKPMHWYIMDTAGVESIPHFTGVVQKITHELGKIATSIPHFDEPKNDRHDSDNFKIKRDILMELCITAEDDSSTSDNSEDDDNARTSESDDKALTTINFGGQRRYGRPPGRFNRHNNSYGQHHRRRHTRDSGHKHSSDQKAYEQRCFNCGSPYCRLSACAEPRNQERIEANLQAWRESKKITKPLREINLASISSSSNVIAEAMSAEIYLEHCKAAAQPTNFFDSEGQGGKAELPIDTNSNISDSSILFSSFSQAQSTTTSAQQADLSMCDLPIIDLSCGNIDQVKSTVQDDDLNDQLLDPQSIQFFDIPADIPVLLTAPHPVNAQFLGYCLDSSSAKSVVGERQYALLCKSIKHKLKLKISGTHFKFGKTTFPSLGSFTTRLKVNGERYLEMTIEAVAGDFPLLIELEIMRQNGLVLDYGRDQLKDKSASWELPISYARGHSFVGANDQVIMFTKPELENLHLHFFQPSTGKLYNLLKRVRTSKNDDSVTKVLEDIVKACATCSEYHSSSFIFRAALPPDELMFNHELAVDLIWLEKTPVLHVIDTHTMYQNSEVVMDKSANSLWEAFLRIWVTIFIGFPNTLRLDHESSFDSVSFRSKSAEVGMRLQFSGVESHNSIGVGEKYDDPLRRVFKKVKEYFPQMDKETALRLALKGCNDTMGPNGLVPTLLIFGTMPALPIPDVKFSGQKERMEAQKAAKEEMERISAEQKLLRALQSKLPPSARYHIQPGDLVQVFREESRKWIGPVRVIKMVRKIIHVTDGVKTKAFNAAQVVPITIKNANEDEALDLIYKHSDAVQNQDESQQTYLTEILNKGDPRILSDKAKTAVQKGLDGLYSQGVLKNMKR